MSRLAVTALISGLLFGAGLALSGMTDPGKVTAFLDITGRWDPSLAFVMGAALLVTIPAFAWVRGQQRPLVAPRFHLPTLRDLDRPLLIGSALFGIGWGVAGLCPGPAVANVLSGSPQILLFIAMMIAGMWLRDRTAGRGS